MTIERFVELMKTDKVFWCLDSKAIRSFPYKYSVLKIVDSDYYDAITETHISRVYETKEEAANILIDLIKETYLNSER
jgi:hypothetical protein